VGCAEKPGCLGCFGACEASPTARPRDRERRPCWKEEPLADCGTLHCARAKDQEKAETGKDISIISMIIMIIMIIMLMACSVLGYSLGAVYCK
jgi:hypothetical protein